MIADQLGSYLNIQAQISSNTMRNEKKYCIFVVPFDNSFLCQTF